MEFCILKELNHKKDEKGDCYYVECTKCKTRGWVRSLETKRKCPVNKQEKIAAPPSEPTLVQKAASYVKSTVKHIATGAELRSEEEIAAIFEICKLCEFFKLINQKKPEDGSTCSKCGCSLSKAKSNWSNKIARKTESCPLKPPKWGKGTENP